MRLTRRGGTAITTLFLMTPAAYDRIVEQGEQTESLFRVASFFVIASMISLSAGMSGDLLVVAKVTGSMAVGVVAGVLSLLFISGLWFGYTLYRRHQNQRVRAQPAIEGSFFNRSQ